MPLPPRHYLLQPAHPAPPTAVPSPPLQPQPLASSIATLLHDHWISSTAAYNLVYLFHYEGVLVETGEVFDTTHEDNSIFTFELGAGTVIKSWDMALRTMKVGEIAKITCKPEYAYGSAGSPPEIPPDATLIFEVELVACRPRKGATVGSVSDEKARLEELKRQREIAAALKDEEKKKREEAKAAAATRVQAKLDAKKNLGKGKGKGK